VRIVRRLPTAAVAIGELSALTLLAPMEWQTARYVGAPPWAAWTVTGVVYAVAVLAIFTSELIWAALTLVWISGIVGAIHAATIQAKTEHQPFDATRAATSIAVVTIVVLAMAAVWHLGQVWHTRKAAEDEQARGQAAQEATERRQATERATQARRDHELTLLRERQETADRAARIAAEDEARRAQRDAEARAADEASRAAEHARNLELLRAQSEAQRAPRATTPKAAQPARNTAPKKTATGPQTASELQRRAEAPGRWVAAVAGGPEPSAATVADWLYGPGEHDEKQKANARAHISKWRRDTTTTPAQTTSEASR
jgi:hypothetical protein